jgi:citrate synthase
MINLDEVRTHGVRLTSDALYMSAAEAAQVLEVTVATLYAYVSRKQIRSERMAGSRARRYWRADIERLRGGEPTAAPEPVATSLCAESSITLITDGGLYFRGKDAVALARHASLESLAALLWEADEDTLFGTVPTDIAGIWPAMRPSFAEVGLLERVVALFPLIERADPRAYDLSPQGYARTGADVLRWFATLLTKSSKPSTQPLHTFLARQLKAPAGFDEIIRALLVLSADHEFDPITFAVRAVANVGVTPYQAVITGVIASQGQRFQAERYGSCSQLLHEILTDKDGSAAIVKRLRNGQPLPGFSAPRALHDARTSAMMATLRNVLGRDRELSRLLAAENTARDASGVTMDFILAALFVGHRLGLIGEELAITGLGRIVGWIAHAMEQYHRNALVRPHAAYVGPLP